MSRRAPVFWMVVSLAIFLTTAVVTPIAQADSTFDSGDRCDVSGWGNCHPARFSSLSAQH